MELWAIILIAVGLAMDCFAVALSASCASGNFRLKNLFVMAFLFGLFQSLMTTIGWLTGQALAKIIQSVDHWVAFGLLLIIGIKMMAEGIEKEGECKSVDYTSGKRLILLSFATSIDALAVGVSFSLVRTSLVVPILAIGAGSFLFTLLGGFIGKKTGDLLGKRAELFGGLVLVGIGVKILLEHLLKHI